MPRVTDYGQQPGTEVAVGPAMQSPVPAAVHGLPATIPASGHVTSNLILSDGYQLAAIGVTSTQGGTVTVQRYLDDAGTVKQGAALTATLTASAPQVLNVTDGNPFASFTVDISNSNGSQASLSNLGILLQAR
jgi:hypothetical protein